MGNIDLSNINIANIQKISNMTVSEILAQMKALGIGISGDNYTIRDYSDIITGDIVVGNNVSMGGYDWTVVSIQPANRIFYLISKNIIEKCQYSSNSSSTYAKSNLASVAKTFGESLPSNVRDNLLVQTAGGVSQKCHAPTHDQITTWFPGESARIASYNDDATSYWLTDNGYTTNAMDFQVTTEYALIVNESGQCGTISTVGLTLNIAQERVNTTQGFRAVVALMM